MKASWNTESYEKFLAPTFRIKPDWERDLLHDFITLKSSTFGVIPAIFGKDGPYTEDKKDLISVIKPVIARWCTQGIYVFRMCTVC